MKVLLVDDHVLIRDALRSVLREVWDRAAIIEAADARQAMHSIEANPDLDLVLLDLTLPDGNGFDTLSRIRERHPAMAVVILSASDDRDAITRAFELGVVGFIPKSAQREVMLSALKLVCSGGIYVPPEVLGRPQPPPATARPELSPSLSKLGLTERQLEVLALMMQGKSNKAICRELDIAEPTVKNHVTCILKALKVSNRTEAVIAASALGHGDVR